VVEVLEWLSLSDADLTARLEGTPLARPTAVGIRRNAAIVAGNSHDARCVPLLFAQRTHGDVAVRRAAAWALGQAGTGETFALIEAWEAIETDSDVREELAQATTTLRGRLA
jgi:epoxyqueuosine reductase